MVGGFPTNNPPAFAFGVIGTIISFVVYLSPMPTFYSMFRNKSTGQYHALPYVVPLFSAILWIYYALLEENASLLIGINAFGCFIEATYVTMFLVYAPRRVQINTMKIILLLITVVGLFIVTTLMLSHGTKRVAIVGWVCDGCSVLVFASPLSVIVLRSESARSIPFLLTCSLTMNATVWLIYGILLKDKFVAIPNIFGIPLGVFQIILYKIYNDEPENDGEGNGMLQELPVMIEELVPQEVEIIQPIDMVQELPIMIEELVPQEVEVIQPINLNNGNGDIEIVPIYLNNDGGEIEIVPIEVTVTIGGNATSIQGST